MSRYVKAVKEFAMLKKERKAHLRIAAHRWHHFLQRVLFSKPVDLQDIRQGWLHVASQVQKRRNAARPV